MSILRKDENVYQDGDHWVAEFFNFGEWHLLGNFGSRHSAVLALVKSRRAL